MAKKPNITIGSDWYDCNMYAKSHYFKWCKKETDESASEILLAFLKQHKTQDDSLETLIIHTEDGASANDLTAAIWDYIITSFPNLKILQLSFETPEIANQLHRISALPNLQYLRIQTPLELTPIQLAPLNRTVIRQFFADFPISENNVQAVVATSWRYIKLQSPSTHVLSTFISAWEAIAPVESLRDGLSCRNQPGRFHDSGLGFDPVVSLKGWSEFYAEKKVE